MFGSEEHGDTQQGRNKAALGSLIIGSSAVLRSSPVPDTWTVGRRSPKRMAMPYVCEPLGGSSNDNWEGPYTEGSWLNPWAGRTLRRGPGWSLP